MLYRLSAPSARFRLIPAPEPAPGPALDARTVCVEASEVWQAEQMDKLGMEVVPVELRDAYAFGGIRQNGMIEAYGHTMQPFRVTNANGQPVSVDGSAAGRVSGFSVSETSMTFTVKADTGSWGLFPTTFNLDLANGGGEYLIGGRCGSNCSGTPRHKWLG